MQSRLNRMQDCEQNCKQCYTQYGFMKYLQLKYESKKYYGLLNIQCQWISQK